MSVKIITDSTSYIPKELIEEYDITVVSLNVIINNESYRETELKNAEFYKMIEEWDKIPTSSQPSLDELVNAIEKKVADGNEVFCIFLSSKMSGTFSSAHIAKDMVLEKYPNAKIEIFDSATNSMQMGYEVIESAKCAKDGLEMGYIIDKAISVRKNSRFLFVPDTLKYLKKGGRIGRASALVGGILQIRPILTVENGETTVFDKVRTKKKAVDIIVHKVIDDCSKNKIGGVIVHHINSEEEGKALARKLEEKLNITVKVKSIGPVIGVHVGPGSIGVAYFTL